MIDAFIKSSIKQAAEQRIRLFLLLNGENAWHQTLLDGILPHFETDKTLFINNDTSANSCLPQVHNLTEAKGYLGQELQCVIYDYRIGLDPDILGITSGCITAGGLLVLLAPAIEKWVCYQDPQYQRIISANTLPPDNSLYVHRFIQRVKNSAYCIQLDSHSAPTSLPQCAAAAPNKANRFVDQQKAIDAIVKVVSGKRRQPTVLIADRGRGKSAALGLAAQQIIKEKNIKIVVTGTSKRAVQTVFQHAVDNDISPTNSQHITYIPYDQLASTAQPVDLLLIDEASGIPLSITAKLLQLYPRIALACTVHGYEGTGKGYLIQLDNLLHKYCRGYRACTLDIPMRWGENDPLEKALYDLLLLDTKISTINKKSANSVKIEQLSPSQLIEDENLLRQLYALLAHAHYRTGPFNLRYLLDNTSLSIFAIFTDGQLAGVAMVSLEGNFSDQQVQQIYLNQHRPNGHLLPQILSAQIGIANAAKSLMARIVRIVIHPDLQRQGLGTTLLKHIETTFKNRVDHMGAVFALNDASLSFWLQSNYPPLWIGQKKSKNTATHNVVVLNAFSDKGNKIISTATENFRKNLPVQLSRYYNEIDSALINKIYQALGKVTQAEPITQQQLTGIHNFVGSGHHLFNNIASLIAFVDNLLLGHYPNFLSGPEKQFLVERILQNRPWAKCIYPQIPSEKKQAEKYLIAVIEKALSISKFCKKNLHL